MSLVNFDLLRFSFHVRQTVQSVERKLDTCKLSARGARRLVQQLDEAHHLFHSLSPLIQGQIVELEESMVVLYGRIEEIFTTCELAQIRQAAKEVEHSLHHASLARKVDRLKKRLATFCAHHRLARGEQSVLAQARESLRKADAVLGRVSAPTWDPSEESEDDLIVLYEIAELLYEGRVAEAMKQFYSDLGESMRSRALASFRSLGGTSIREERALGARALVAVAEGGVAPSEAEIEALFREARTGAIK
jgi:hypothetical protein